MALSVLIARDGGTAALGEFAFAYSIYMIVQLCAREGGISPLIAELPAPRTVRKQAARSSLIGCIFAVPAFILGILLGSPAVIIVALSLQGMTLLNYSKTLNLTLSDGRLAVFQDSILVLMVATAGVANASGFLPSIWLVVAWAGGSAVIGYGSALFQGHRIFPRWQGRGAESKVSLVFAGQTMLGSGWVHILTFLLTALTGPNLVGSLRGASTIIGPANLLTTTVQPLTIRYLAGTAPTRGRIDLRRALNASLGVTALYAVSAGGLVLVGFVWGQYILEDAWAASEPLLLLVALDGLAVACGVIAMVAHRTVWASGRAARITLLMLIVRTPLVLGGALIGGANGAAWGFLLSTCIASATWWLSLILLNKETR